jgi:two-component system phosphate regulon response regulator PhoB
MSNQSVIFVVEDEDDIRELLSTALNREGFEPRCFASGEDALKAIAKEKPDLMLLDLLLPGTDGLSVCRSLRSLGMVFPILLVTALGSEADIVRGLESGADDYITKPFSLPVLLARVRRSLTRRRVDEHGEARGVDGKKAVLEAGPLRIDVLRHEAKAFGQRLDLSSSEFALLAFLMEHPGWVYTRTQIVRAVHGDGYPVTDRSVDVMVLSLRRKLGEAGAMVETVRGVGYRFGGD